MPSSFTGTITFEAGHPLFEDHFPGAPRVPGSLVARALLDRAARAFPEYAPAGLERLRFRRFLPPGAYACAFRLEGSRLRCRVLDGDRVLVEGSVSLAPRAGAGGAP